MKVGKWEISWEQVRMVLLWIALPLIVGVLIAAAIPRPVIGVVYLDMPIDTYSARYILTQLDYARTHANVRAVVLTLDSPGGTVADTETIYQELLALRKVKPVVASVGSMAASGAYYLASGTDYIIANPTSEVGNIGVIGYLPDSPAIFESTISTGPYKLWGEPRDTYLREMEMIKQGFYQAVQLGRGNRLKVGPEVILTGRIWPGSEALRVGLIDSLGSPTDAAAKAAHLANVGHYQVVDLAVPAYAQLLSSTNFFYQTKDGITLSYPNKPGLYLLYVPPLPVEK
jgi:protease-4